MSGIIVSVKGRYAVLLTKNSDFIKVKNKNYSVGDKVKIPQYKGQILAAAASFIVVCGGISSYFVPAKYMSVDINPSVMMTINIYNRVINTKPLNDDAEILLSKTDVSGMSVSDSMDELIKKSEEIGYLNEHNKDVIVEVVDGIGKIKLPDKNYGDVEVIIENADTLKEEAPQAIARIKGQNLKTVMLTGDALESAEKIAALAGVEEVHARLLPEDKLSELQKIREKDGSVMFVGDGINDAPVLAGADVGAAMGSGADAAIEAADVVFMNSNMDAIPQAIALANKTGAVAMQNVIFAIGIKVIVMILGLTGIYTNMWLAVFADTGVAFLCILNSIRILRQK